MSENKDWTGNRKSVWTTNGCTNHSINEREKNDFYASDPTTLDKLEKKFKIPHYVYECACGMGHLSEHLKEQGHDVYSSDLIDRGYGVTGVNFLEQLTMPEVLPTQDVCILTNPPYSLVTEFILHALDILPMDAHAIFLLKTTSIEGKKRFEQIYRNTPPNYVFQFVERIICAKGGDFERTKKEIGAGAQAYCWMVFKKGYKGPTILDWI